MMNNFNLLRSTSSNSSYQLGESIGQGGFGKVFKAYVASTNLSGLKIGDKVAIKRQEYNENEYNFIGEIQTLKKGKLVKIYEQWAQNGKHYIVMEPLGDCIHNMYPIFGSVKLVQACQIGIEMVKAVRELHEIGYIHKDIKLDNLMIKHKVPSLGPNGLDEE